MADDAPETNQDETPQAGPLDAAEAISDDAPAETLEAAPDQESDDNGFVAVMVNGALLAMPAGMSLGAALLLQGIRVLRHSPHDQAPRGLFCGMGVCFECLVTVDGRPGQQACRLRVRDGMHVTLPEPPSHG